MPRIRVGSPPADPSGNAFAAAVAQQLGGGDASIEVALQARPKPLDEDGEPRPRALLVDQFEELFTAHPEHWSQRPGLFDGLSEALSADEGLRVVLVIREEYLAQLDPYATRLPGGLKTRFRLDRLDRASALEAVTQPLVGTGRAFAPGVAESLVDDLLKLRVSTGAGSTIDVPGEFVEPVHLQVVCRRLWDELPAAVTEIRAEHSEALADLDAVLARFYEDALASASTRARVSEQRLRTWVQNELITPGGTRSTVYRGRGETEKLPNAAIDSLEENRLVRAEQRAGALWYELTHDRLIGPIQSSNARFAAARTRKRRRRLAIGAGGAIGLMGLLIGAAFALATDPAGDEGVVSGICTSCSATLAAPALDTGVTYGRYLSRLGVSSAGVTPSTLDEEGVLATVDAVLRGKGRYPLDWQVVNTTSGNIVAQQETPILLQADTEVDRGRSVVWVPSPKQRGIFRIALRIFRPGDPTGAQPLDSVTTKPFTGEESDEVVVTFSIRKAGTGSGRVIGRGLDCGSLCAAQFEFGSAIALRAVPERASVFAGWRGARACGVRPLCRVVAGPTTSIQANFERGGVVE